MTGSSLEQAHSGHEILFSVGHGKFNFPPLYAERGSFCWILVVFFCHPDNNRSRLEEVPCLDYSLKKFFIFFNHYAKNGLKKDRFASTWPDSNIRIVLGWFWMSWNKGKYSGSWTEKLMVLLSWSTCSTWHSVTTGVPHVPAFLISEKLILTRAGLFKAGLVLIPG